MPVQRKGMRALQIWCSRVTSDYHCIEINDLSTSFRNGLAFVGIIHHFRPDLITHPDKLDPEDIIGNNDLAYKVAESKLEVPSLLDSEDMLASEEPDKFSIVTYLAQFYHLFKNDDKNINVSPNVSLHLSSESDSDVAATPPLGGTPTGTPTSNKKTFDRNDLIEKYGEELFSNDKKSNTNASNNKSNTTSNVTSPPLSSSKNNKIIEEEDEGVVVNMRAMMTRPKRMGGVASMCKNFEMKAKIGVEK